MGNRAALGQAEARWVDCRSSMASSWPRSLDGLVRVFGVQSEPVNDLTVGDHVARLPVVVGLFHRLAVLFGERFVILGRILGRPNDRVRPHGEIGVPFGPTEVIHGKEVHQAAQSVPAIGQQSRLSARG